MTGVQTCALPIFYSFTGEKKAEIKGDYEIIARVEGMVFEDKEDKVVWQKDFVLLPKETFQTNDSTININQNIEFTLSQYNEFAKQVIEASKVNANTRLIVLMNVNIKGSANNKTLEDKVTPSLLIPLNTSYFQISGNLTEEKPGKIEEVKQVQLPVNQNKVLFYGIVLGILLI